ncbi:hypothetical protein ACVWYG_003180 [Pedobacter sp. UYEF25]
MIFKETNDLSDEELFKLKKILNSVLLVLIIIILASYTIIFLAGKSSHIYGTFLIPVILFSPLYFNFRRLIDIKSEINLKELDL